VQSEHKLSRQTAKSSLINPLWLDTKCSQRSNVVIVRKVYFSSILS